MSGEPELRLPPETARLLTEGIGRAHGELKALAGTGDAAAGQGFSDLALSAVELGHRDLAAGFGAFCDRWGWGVRDLVRRGDEFAKAVGLAAGALHEHDEYVKGTMKVVVNGLNGNPHLSEEEVRARSWDAIASQRPTDGADWSGASFGTAHEEVEQAWNDTNYDVQHRIADSLEGAGVHDSRERELLDTAHRGMYDPTDEAVRRAEGPAGGTG
ncbi:hypothetical protein [Streptomyces roseolilacinus]|uniref:hypothetical protein n=1 Tax=Streptomyces roseolilacinus TaxID=66904 RepID=UPI0038009CB9